ncbi:hypothetical protein BST61_g8140 [Cercospora zeina]
MPFSGACKAFCRRTLTGHSGSSSQPCLKRFTPSAGVRSRAPRVTRRLRPGHCTQRDRPGLPALRRTSLWLPVDAPASDHT